MYFSAPRAALALRNKTSKKISGSPGRWTFSLTACLTVIPGFYSKAAHRFRRAYGLISRFSEDIDITVFREDLGQAVSLEELESLSRKKRQARRDGIKDACREYIQKTLLGQFENVVSATLAESGIEANIPNVVVDPGDPDGQSLLFWYPSVTSARDDYVRPAVKIESGAKSALDPHQTLTIRPYASDELPRLSPDVDNVT